MEGLLIESAMVNPKRKAEFLNVSAPGELLNKEWVQIRNTSPNPYSLDDVELQHLVYGSQGSSRRSLVLKLQGTLPSTASLRIHTGKGNSWYDDELNVYHAYRNRTMSSFQYQIIRPDTLFLVKFEKVIDQAEYEVPLPVNKRLKRVSPPERRLMQPI